MAYNPNNPNGQALMSGSTPVVIASNQTNIPISGTVIANAGTNLNTSALALETTANSIKNAVELIDNAISGSSMQVNVVNSLPSGNNYVGKIRLTDGTTDAEVIPLTNYNAQAVAIVDASGNQITSFGSTNTITSVNNTTTTPLGGSATFTGTADTNDLPDVMVSCITDVAGTLFFDFSVDGTNWNVFPTVGFALSAGVHEFHVALKGSRRFRVRLVNGVSAQSYLRLYTYYGVFRQVNAPLSQPVSNDADAVTTHTVLAGVYTGTTYNDVKVSKFGGLVTAGETPLFRGMSATFRTLGRAGTIGQKILAIHNATSSTVKVRVNAVSVDMYCTVVKAITVVPPIVRIWKFTAIPTNGTQITKNKIGGSTTSNSTVTVWNDSSADGTGSVTTLTVTLPAGTILDQMICPRVITAAGEVSSSSLRFKYDNGLELDALEGICVFLDYTAATSNPVTDMWVASIEWEEI